MQAKSKNSNTKDALASAFLQVMHSGKPLGKIRVRELTEACGVDRQTFYYYFKNIYELAEYAYNHEIRRMLLSEGIESLEELGWKDRVRKIISVFEGDTMLREVVLPALGDKQLRTVMFDALESLVNEEYLPHLLNAGFDEESAAQHVRYITYLLEALLTGWLSGELEQTSEEIIDLIEEMLIDYTNGVALRLKAE